MTNEQLAALAQQGDQRALFDLWEAVKPFCMAAAGHVYRRHDPAKLSGRGVNYVCTRINGHKPWTTDEMEIIGELLEIPRDELIDYFSAKGTLPPCRK